jgi:hypothetical protein
LHSCAHTWREKEEEKMKREIGQRQEEEEGLGGRRRGEQRTRQ